MMLKRWSRTTRWLAYAIVFVLGLLHQVLLFQKIQIVQDQLDSTPTRRIGGRGARNVSVANSAPTKTTTSNHAALSDTSSLTAADTTISPRTHNLPNGQSLPVATSKSDINSLASMHDAFCVLWDVSSDAWWTHHVTWEIGHEDDTHYCFQRITHHQRVQLLEAVYRNQFQNDCGDPVFKKMWNSGLSNDLRNIVDGLKDATETIHRPFQVAKQPWHYASPKPFNVSTAACPSQDMFCYFLPFSNCPRVPVNATIKQIGFFDRMAVLGPKLFNRPTRWYLEYVSRPQTWLRRRVYNFVQQQNIVAPCTTLHVRRGDVIAHGTYARRYFSIAEYIQASADRIQSNIFLLTDDRNAIGEALHEFPNYHWMYIDRPRYRGAEGGFEHHLPSNDPVLEITVLLATFRLVRRCTSMVRSSSAFADYLWGEIKDEHEDNPFIWWKRVDQDGGKIFSEDNIAMSANVSKAYDVGVLS